MDGAGEQGAIRYEGQRLAYTSYGGGDRVTVLLPGLLLAQTMQARLARELAGGGNRVITLDPLGHGLSSRPGGAWRYSMGSFARQTVALLDHLGLEQAIVGGTSLGANVTLELAVLAPERVAGMIVEMPVLDNAIPAAAAAFTPLLFALKYGQPGMRWLARAAATVPRRPLPFLAQIGLDWLAQDPAPSAAVLGGLLYGRVAPDRQERRALTAPALVIGHSRDPLHPFSDADMLARELPDATLVHAHSVLELRLSPERLTRRIAEFVSTCWDAAGDPVTRQPNQRRERR